MRKQSVLSKLKGNLLVRLLVWPYMIVKKKRQQKGYMDSEEAKRLKDFKNKFIGTRFFLVGNGPSLKVEDLDKLKKEHTCAANRIIDIFSQTQWRPEFYFIVDSDAEILLRDISENDIENVFLSIDLKQKCDNDSFYCINSAPKYVVNRYNDKTSHISEDISKYFSNGYTVLFTALQFAIYAGAKEIYLLGVDFDYPIVSNKYGKRRQCKTEENAHFDGARSTFSYLNYYSVLYAWENAKRYCDEHGIIIKNATRGGKLEIFERVDFDSLFI